MVSYAPMDRLCASAERNLYIRALMGPTTDILVLTDLKRPRITGGVLYRARPQEKPHRRYRLTSECITPRSGPQRQRNEFSYLRRDWGELIWGSELVLVFARNDLKQIQPLDNSYPTFLQHLARIEVLLQEHPEVLSGPLGDGRHKKLLEPLKKLIAGYIEAANVQERKRF